MKKHQEQKNKQQGFTLLFAVIISVLVLAVGASMITIALKQVILSGSGRESQFAFYAANTGIECALYWDINGSIVEDSQIKYVFPPNGAERISDTSNLTCAGGNIATGNDFPTGSNQNYAGSAWIINGDTTTFRIAITNDINADTSSVLYCAEVTVQKDDVGDDVITTITSQGLNTCDPDNNARAVQRGLVLQYES